MAACIQNLYNGCLHCACFCGCLQRVYLADPGERQPQRSAQGVYGGLLGRRCGKQQFVIVTAAE